MENMVESLNYKNIMCVKAMSGVNREYVDRTYLYDEGLAYISKEPHEKRSGAHEKKERST